MKIAKIYKPSKSAMQSGVGNSDKWLLEYAPENTRFIEPIMHWNANSDMREMQVRLFFDSQKDAEEYAISNRINYIIIQPETKSVIIKQYINNFK